MRQFGNKKGGFTIIEVIVSIFVLIVGILGAYLVVQFPFYYTSVSASQLTASYLAQEGAEIVRNVRDANLIVDPENWDNGLVTAKGTDCEVPEFCETAYDSPTLVSRSGSANLLKINGDGFYDYSPLGSSTKFTREIVITPDGTEKLKVSVIVFWYEKGQNRQVEVREDLYKWRKD